MKKPVKFNLPGMPLCTGDIGRLAFRAGQIASLSPPQGEGRQLRGGFNFGYVRPIFSASPCPRAAPAAPPAPVAPIALVRNGKEFQITGNQSTVRAGTEILVKTERPEVSLSLSEMNKDSCVIFELLDFIARLPALIPKSRVNLNRFDSEHPCSLPYKHTWRNIRDT